ncbi:MAG: hypothetical protein IIV24_05455 [Alistipes sp.]|nr:hypothetical protein [Alistipes sp.]MBR0338704.1 hypothetical protein [Alistipes sp.]
MVWHDVVAWVVIVAAVLAAVVWCVRRIICPVSHCEGCTRDCKRRVTNK